MLKKYTSLSNNKISLSLLILTLIVGGVTAQATGILNTPSGGYLFCVDSKTKVITHPGTTSCPKGSKKLTIGASGKDGRTLWNGVKDPESTWGAPGDMFINSITKTLFGPKNLDGTWPTGVSMVGPKGDQGPIGLTGATGVQGPIGGNGPIGPTGVSMIGPAGPAGPAGSIEAPTAPAFTLSSSSETATVNTAATGFNILSTGGAIASFTISSTPPGMSFNQTTGVLSGTPTSISSATPYTITASNSTGSATRVFTLTVAAAVYTVGSTGPGGGKVFYVAATSAGFYCGPTLSETCYYLEAATTTGGNSWGDANPGSDIGGFYWSGNTLNAIGDLASRTAVGTGYANTLAIVNQVDGGNTIGKAGTASRSYRGPNNLRDWYLPSKDELNQLCKWSVNQAWTSDATLCGIGPVNSGPGAAGFMSANYVSSTEYGNQLVWGQVFPGLIGTGVQNNKTKKADIRLVRPIRAF